MSSGLDLTRVTKCWYVAYERRKSENGTQMLSVRKSAPGILTKQHPYFDAFHF
jgi:hypothetical protein